MKPLDIFARAKRFGAANERLTDAQLAKLEARLGVTVPLNVRQLLQSCGGLEFLGYCRDLEGRLLDVRGILGNHRSEERSVRDAIESGILPRDYIPIADDDGDNLFAVASDGRVVWAQHDALEGAMPRVVTESLEDWIASLVTDDDSELEGP